MADVLGRIDRLRPRERRFPLGRSPPEQPSRLGGVVRGMRERGECSGGIGRHHGGKTQLKITGTVCVLSIELSQLPLPVHNSASRSD